MAERVGGSAVASARAMMESGFVLTHVDVELPVKPRVDVEAVLELPAGKQALGEHGGEEDGQGVVVAEAWDLDAHLYPSILALALGFVLAVDIAHVQVTPRYGKSAPPVGGWSPLRLFHLCFYADQCFGTIFEGNACASVGSWQDIELGAHGTEVGGALGVVEADGRGLREGGAQERQFCRREANLLGLCGRHDGGWLLGAGSWVFEALCLVRAAVSTFCAFEK